MANGESDTAVALVLGSGAAQRRLRVVQDASRVACLSAALRHLDDPALLAVLRIVQSRMARACRPRAVQVAERFQQRMA